MPYTHGYDPDEDARIESEWAATEAERPIPNPLNAQTLADIFAGRSVRVSHRQFMESTTQVHSSAELPGERYGLVNARAA